MIQNHVVAKIRDDVKTVRSNKYIYLYIYVYLTQYKKVAPVGDRVFVKIDKEEDKTTSGILLPSSAQQKPTQGEVVVIGDAKALKVDTDVVYTSFADKCARHLNVK